MKYYMLEGKTPIATTGPLKWSAWGEDAGRQVSKTPISDEVEVSTVFLGIDHNFTGKGLPIVFETMVFGGVLDQEQARYTTWAEAEAGHKVMVEMVKKELAEAKQNSPIDGRKDRQMVDDQQIIKEVLSQAENIYSLEGDKRIMLKYQDDRLYQNSPIVVGLAFKPIVDVKHIVYIAELNAWQVIWKV